ncbi:MAG: type II toxin-antitoxin system VapC family toxin [Chloroflexi bacterium]|nr:type II toxin-antitoxin system VapC family toxin [Chloroflexota bacterium]
MAEADRYVLDATVANKWHLLDEQYRDIALNVRQDFEDDRIELIAPSQLRFEVAAAILKATRNPERVQRLEPRVGERILEVFQSWNIQYIPSESLTLPAYRIARQFGCSYYDGLYVALAQATATPLLHADNKLRNALRDRFPLAVWIEDYTAAPER